ncbi:MAG: hypothetical protein IKK71_00700, partial [Clostridia bacterium]|nr:hypothetical protein [Clostridia bacterium]
MAEGTKVGGREKLLNSSVHYFFSPSVKTYGFASSLVRGSRCFLSTPCIMLQYMLSLNKGCVFMCENIKITVENLK